MPELLIPCSLANCFQNSSPTNLVLFNYFTLVSALAYLQRDNFSRHFIFDLNLFLIFQFALFKFKLLFINRKFKNKTAKDGNLKSTQRNFLDRRSDSHPAY